MELIAPGLHRNPTLQFIQTAAAKFLLLAACLTGTDGALGQAFTPGDIVVTTYGNAGTPASNSTFTDGVPTPISLEEFTASGQFVLTDTLPTTDSGGNFGIVGEYGSSSEGNIQLTGNGTALTIGGYEATPSFADTGGPAGGYSTADGVALAQSTSTAVPRLVALIDANGTVTTSTVLNDIYSTNNPRSVFSPNGTSLYVSGQGSSTANQGIFLTTVGTNTVTNPANAPTPIFTTLDTRFVTESGGNLFYSIDKKNQTTGIFMYTGLPTSSASNAVRITAGNNGLTGANLVNFSPEGYFFANATTLYVADTGVPKSGGTADGGIQKWTFNGSTWNLSYTLTDPNFVSPTLSSTVAHGETGFAAVTGEMVGSQELLFATSFTAGDADPDGLYEITDTLSATSETGESFTELQASAANDVFKGVSFTPSDIPEPTTDAVIGGACMILYAIVRRRFRLPGES
jgi:hypothetical protein